MQPIALVVGGTGIAGRGISQELLRSGRRVYSLARHAEGAVPGVETLTADLQDIGQLGAALDGLKPTEVYFSTWSRRATEAENIAVNAGMVRNLLNAVAPARSVRHVALVTGLKHYLGPFDAYLRAGTLPPTPVREEQKRLDLPNFYYAQEDEVFAASARDGFTWSVHRPHTMIGSAVGNAMNMGSTLATYASLCRELGRPFRFPGSAAQWNGLSDVTDVELIGKQVLWAANTPLAQNEAFNIVNGDYFRWSWLWPRLAQWFGVEAVGFTGTVEPLEKQMANDASVWKAMSAKHGLREADITRLASPWHTDLDLSRPIEVMTDMSKSRALGFLAYQNSEQSFLKLFNEMRENRLIP
jgi:nucleoside-diphosphate-sugar epimerase